MPDISNELDRVAAQMASKYAVAQEEIVESLMEIVKNKPPEEATAIISQVDIDEMMRLKMAGAFVLYEQGVIKVLENTFTTSVLSELTLRSILDNSKRFVSAEFINKSSVIMRQSIIDGIATNKFPSQVVKELREVFRLEERHLATIVNTGFSQYSNAITNLMSVDYPDNQRYIYIGANDEKTRDACKEKIGFSPATKKSILNKYGSLNNEIWNCRHKWEPMSDDKEGQGFEEAVSA